MRLYTIAEARELLPEVRPVLTALRDSFVALRAVQESVSAQARGATANGHLDADAFTQDGGENRVEAFNRALRAAARRLEEWGIELKDPEKGLIDFRSERDGEVVYLCYLLGEPDITHWHRRDDGFAGRQPL